MGLNALQSRPHGIGGLGLAGLMQALSNVQTPARKVRSTRRAPRAARMAAMSKNSRRKKARTPNATPQLGMSTFMQPNAGATPASPSSSNLLRMFLFGGQ